MEDIDIQELIEKNQKQSLTIYQQQSKFLLRTEK